MFKKKLLFIMLFCMSLLIGCNSSSDSSYVSNDSDIYYTINFFSNDSTSGSMQEVKVKAGETVILPANTFVKTGYTFLGWSLTADGETVYYDQASVTVENHITLYAVWQDSSLSVNSITFSANSGTGADIVNNVADGDTYTIPSCNFHKEGFIFKGWSESADGQALYFAGDNIVITKDMVLYAVWEQESGTYIYSVKVLSNGGTGSPIITEIENGGLYKLPECNFSNTGYKFTGWSESMNGSTNIYQAGESVVISKDTIFYAIWVKDETVTTYKVTINSNNGSSETIISEVLKGGRYSLPANNFSYPGYIFLGWSLSANGNADYQPGQTVIIEHDIEFYAVWQYGTETYTVTLNPNDADESNVVSYEVLGSTYTQIPENTFTKKGYYFEGWSIERDGEVKYLDMASFTAKEDTNLYAVWRPVDMLLDEYTVTFYANGGYEYMAPLKLSNGKVGALTECKYKRNGYDFAGWSIELDGDVQYKDRAAIKIEKDISLYAVWTKKDFADKENMSKVTFNANGGMGSDITYYIDNGQIFYLDYNTFTNQDKVFTGWSSNPLAKTAEYYDGAYIFVNNDTTYYAVWSEPENAVKVTFDLDGGEGNMPEYIYVSSGTTIYLPLLNCTRYNSEARSYSLTRGDSVNTISPGSAYLIDKDTTFYVIWRLVNLNIGGACEDCKNTTKWVKGVNVQPGDWVPMFGLDENYQTAVWYERSNWFDNYQGHHPMCWAAAGSNMILWWYSQNKEYVDKYIALKGEEYKGPKFTYYDNYYEGASDVFSNFFLKIWGDYGGNQTGTGLLWFLNGRLIANHEKVTGGYFKDVFENKVFVTTSYNILRKNFNEIITEALKNNKIVGLGITTTGPHAITVWGAEYDEAGYIKGLYISDSATSSRTNDNRLGGLEYTRILYDGSGEPYMPALLNGRIPVNTIDTFSLGQEFWEEYFKANNISLE